MATELVTFKMEKKFLQEVDASAKASATTAGQSS